MSNLQGGYVAYVSCQCQLYAHVQALGPQLGKALAELGEAERDRQEHLQLYASFECAPAPQVCMLLCERPQTCFACGRSS